MWHKHRSIPHFSLFNSDYFFLLGSKIPEQPCKMNHMGAPNGCPPYIKAELLLYTSVCVTPVIVCVCEFKRIVSCRRTESKAIQAGGDDVYNDWMLL